MNTVNARLGRHRHRMHAERRRRLEVANRLATERDWKGDLARSLLEVTQEESDDARS